MAYKDKDKQRAATRECVRRYRARRKGVTPKPICNAQNVTPSVRPLGDSTTVPILAVHSQINKRFTGELTKQRQVSRKGFND